MENDYNKRQRRDDEEYSDSSGEVLGEDNEGVDSDNDYEDSGEESGKKVEHVM
jgi:hypothetical protein